jgi:cystathionine beta-lyase
VSHDFDPDSGGGFDCIIDRRCTDSSKWCRYEADVLPLWVADLDFASPEPVIRALQDRVEHGIFGYDRPPEGLCEVIQERLERLYGWRVEREAIQFMPGVVSAFNLACHAIGAPGDGVLVETPVYPPMLRAPGNADRACQVVPLIGGPDRYEHDFDAFEEAIGEQTSLFLLCNPHNPVGRVFDTNELAPLADICLRNGVVICSDEIHCDIIFKEHRHVPIASIAPEIAAQTITLIAPSKTYNIAGLGISVAVVQNPDLRERLERAGNDLIPGVSSLAYTAGLAAYRDGQAWLDALLTHLEANRDYLVDFIGTDMPGVRCLRPEGTFLAWLDCREAGIPGNPHQFFLEQARVAMNDGPAFGADGEGFVRLNFGCTRGTLADALTRMQGALARL